MQTPYRYFPIEPHWLFPGMQFLPLPVRWSIASPMAVRPYARLERFAGAQRSNVYRTPRRNGNANVLLRWAIVLGKIPWPSKIDDCYSVIGLLVQRGTAIVANTTTRKGDSTSSDAPRKLTQISLFNCVEHSRRHHSPVPSSEDCGDLRCGSVQFDFRYSLEEQLIIRWRGKRRRSTKEAGDNLFRARLEQIIDLKHE